LTNDRPSVVFLSSAPLDDRKLVHTGVLPALAQSADVSVWASSFRHPRYQQMWSQVPAKVEAFPEVGAFPEFPHNYLRRLNEYVWDYRLQSPTRESIVRVLGGRRRRSIRALKVPARCLAWMKLEQPLEQRLERLLLGVARSPEALSRFQLNRPAVVVSTGPNRFEEPAVIAAAKTLGIPTMAAIHSWDNLSTKGRMVIDYDGYIVWSDEMKRELFEFCPVARTKPVYTVGAVQFDTFFQDKFKQSREEFCRASGLDAGKPIVVYGLGSPNLFNEEPAVAHLAARLLAGELGDAQLLVRPHPHFGDGPAIARLRSLGPRVVVQRTTDGNDPFPGRSQDEQQIIEWTNTFRHADVVVNLSSTVSIDAAICDKPVVNLDFDPDPSRSKQQWVKEVNHLWTHFKPIAESGGMWLVNDLDEMVHAVREYLRKPELHREERRWMAEYVCGFVDGRCHERFAQAVLAFVATRR
jgi:hypothetical protein